jgi:hypothetical protein
MLGTPLRIQNEEEQKRETMLGGRKREREKERERERAKAEVRGANRRGRQRCH